LLRQAPGNEGGAETDDDGGGNSKHRNAVTPYEIGIRAPQQGGATD
jgi:hypothetical protein